uniref:Wsv447-like protein n=1 Tax=Trachysalambria curvirostris majanivirus TaxID=2984281 RepID=A0A9C7BN91_9VIRU|nr:MAG: wsv447-like protein [Trachysalambria curvirostris majanivirus]
MKNKKKIAQLNNFSQDDKDDDDNNENYHISLQQEIITRTIVNDIIISKLSGQASIFQLAGLPGSGKTFVVKEIIRKLVSISLINKSQVLICCKNNTAVSAVCSALSSNINDDKYTISDDQLMTFNKMFSFPVIKEGVDIDSLLTWAPKAVMGNLDTYTNAELLIVDEYMTMKSSEIIYIDAMFRLIRYNPQVPFGGLTVLFLGDNRQNSAILSTNNDVLIKGEEKLFPSILECNVVKDYILKLFNSLFGSSSDWIIKGSQILCKKKINALVMTINNCMKEVNNNNSSNNIDKCDDNYRALCNDYNNRHTKGILLEALKITQFKGEEDLEKYFNKISENIQIEYLVLDCHKMRLNDLYNINNIADKLKLIENTNKVITFLNNALSDVVAYKREKFFVLPGMVEEIDGEGQLVIPEREMFNILINEGIDTDCLNEEYSNDNLNELRRIINGALLRDGDDLGVFYNLIFKDYANHINELEKCKSYKDISDYASKVWDKLMINNNEITFNCNENSCINDDNKSSTQVINNRDHYSGYNHEDIDDNTSDDDNDENNNDRYHTSIIKSVDVPDGISFSSTVPERLQATIKLQKTIRVFDKLNTGTINKLKAKARYWFFLKELIKKEEILRKDFYSNRNINDDNNNMSLPPNFKYMLKDISLDTPYWLRAFVMPIMHNSNYNNNQCILPAYSIYISLKSKSFTLNSLKRIDIDKHALGLTYALAIKDLTSKYSMVDLRVIKNFLNNKEENPTNPNKNEILKLLNCYFETLFPSIVREFLHIGKNIIEENKKYIYSDKDKELIYNILEKAKCSESIKLLASEMMSIFISEDKGSNIKYNNKETDKTNISVFKHFKRNKQKRGNIQNDDSYRLEPILSKRIKLANANINNTDMSTTDDRTIVVNDNKNSAVILTKTNNDKNSVAHLVSSIILARMSIKKDTRYDISDNMNSIDPTSLSTFDQSNDAPIANNADNNNNNLHLESLVFRTKFYIDNILLPDNIYAISEKILSQIKVKYNLHVSSSFNHFINKGVDYRMSRCRAIKDYKNILYSIRNNTTKVDKVLLFKGQKVYFTHTNSKVYDFKTTVPFYTQDKGTIVDIRIPHHNKSSIIISVAVDRLGVVAHVEPYKSVQGKATIIFLPIASLLSTTIYSCQGTTLRSCVALVNPARLTPQESYVALTRNDNVRDIKIVTNSKSDIEGLINLKHMLYPDGSRLYPIGVFGERFGTLKKNNIKNKMDMIGIVQKFLLNKSDNCLFFNQKWFETMEEELEKKDNVYNYLSTINGDILNNPNKKDLELISGTSETLIDLFYSCYLSLINFDRIYRYNTITKGSKEFKNFFLNGNGPTNFNKRLPIYISPVIPRRSMGKIFFDLFPHSRAIAVFQVYVNFIFFVYELLSILDVNFAFSPSPSPLSHIKFGCPDNVSLNWKSDRYNVLKDDYLEYATLKDRQCSDIVRIGTGGKYIENSGGEYYIKQEHVAASILHNLRRNIKLDKPDDIAGTGIHGAVLVSYDKNKDINTQFVNQRTLTNINLLSLLWFNTKLAAASSVQNFPFPKLVDIDKSIVSNYEIVAPNYYITCGKVHPFKSIQFLLYLKKIKSGIYNEGHLFHKRFISTILEGGTISSFAVLCYDSVPSESLQEVMGPIEIRELICDNNIGILKCIKTVGSVDALNYNIVNFLNNKDRNHLNNHMVYVSIRLL